MVLEGLVIAIFLLGSFILVASFISLRIIYKTAILHNAFGYLCAAQSIADAIFGGCFVFWATSVMVFFPEIQTSFFGFAFGQIFFYAYYASIWLHLCKSINRCIAIVFPVQYYQQFTIKAGKAFIAAALLLALLSSSTIWQWKCNSYWNTALFKWKLRFYPECWEMTFFDQIIMAIIVVGAVGCDMITLGHLIIFRKKLKQKQTVKGKNERIFFIQTCCSTIAYLILWVFWYPIGNAAVTLTTIVILKTCTWEFFHLSNQIIFIFFTVKGNCVSKIFESLWFTKVKPTTSILITAEH